MIDWTANAYLSIGQSLRRAKVRAVGNEALDLGNIVQPIRIATASHLKTPFYVQFVMGVKNSMPADERIFDFYIETLRRVAPEAQ